MPDYSVIIPTHNEGQNLIETVATFAAAAECCDRHQEGLEIVVVDDQSTDDSIARVEALDLRVPLRVVQPPQRCGTARARRAGAKASTGDVLVNTDAHVSVERGWLHDYEAPVAEIAPDVRERTMFGCRMHNRADYSSYEGGQYTPTPHMDVKHMPQPDTDQPYPVMASIACGHYMPRTLYDKIGGYLPVFMAPWGIDEEICIRLWLMGGQCMVIPTLHMATMYRASFPYHVSMLSVVYNHLFMARMFLDDERFVKAMRARRDANEPVDEAVAKLLNSDIGHYRNWLSEKQRRSIDELFSMFGIDW